MSTWKKLALVKGLALFLSLILFYGDISIYGQTSEYQDRFDKAKAEYQAGNFQASADLLERIYRMGDLRGDFGEKDHPFLARVHLLLAASYELLESFSEAEKHYKTARQYENKPGIEGISFDTLNEYQRLVLEKDIPAKKPAKQVIQKKEIKTKKKFPWFLAVVLVAAAVVGLLLILNSGDGSGEVDPDFDTVELGIEWVSIPAGEFSMGDNFNEGLDYERPAHTVFLDTYSISKHEVTFAQYDRYCLEKSRPLPDDNNFGRDDRPVISVTWDDANDFCIWLAEKTGKNIHLATEAQWEKAARGTDQRRFPWGDNQPDCTTAAFAGCVTATQPVGSFPAGASPYGVLDMAGNVSEWCQDWFGQFYYDISPDSNPLGPESGTTKVFRGGAWLNPAGRLRSSYRFVQAPTDRFVFLGFRIVKE